MRRPAEGLSTIEVTLERAIVVECTVDSLSKGKEGAERGMGVILPLFQKSRVF